MEVETFRTSRAPFASRLALRLLTATCLLAWLLSLGQELDRGVPTLPFFVDPAPSAEGHPVVVPARYTPEEANQPAEIPTPGDLILAVGERDLRGGGRLDTTLALIAQLDAEGAVPVRYLRGGEEHQVRIELARQPRVWRNLVAALLMIAVALVAVWRAPEVPAARAFAFSALGWALHVSFCWGRSDAQSLFGIASSTVGGGIGFAMALRTVLLFPPPLARFDLPSRIGPWLLAPTALGFAIHNFGILAPHGIGLPLALGGNGVLMLAILLGMALRYRRAELDGRRQLRWVALGLYVVAVPQAIVFLIVLWRPEWVVLTDYAWTLNLLFPLFLLVAFVRHHLFDIDRLVTRAATVSLLGGALFAGLFALVPWAARVLESWTAVPHETSQIAMAAMVAAVLFPLQNNVQPWIEARFFPERRRLEHAFDELADEIAGKDDPIDLLQLLVRGLARELDLDRAMAFLVKDGQQVPAALVGRPPSVGLDPRDVERVSRGTRAAAYLQARQALVPVRRAGELVALVWLGPKGSGDVYSAGDLAHLTALAQRTSAELLRVHDEELLAAVEASAAELRVQKEAAERSIEERSHKLAGASHDLRQPLHALSLLVEGLAAKGGDAETRELVGQIETSSRALEEMLTGLLDLSRLEAAEGGAGIGPVALAPLLDQLEQELRPLAEEKGLDLVFLGRPWSVHSEPVMLRRIVRNLVHNAIRYTEHGRVAVSVRRDGEQVRIDVRDSGPGIPEAEQDRIFEAFHRAPGTQDRAEGLGIGLAVVQGLAHQLGHRVSVRSAPGRGSTFSVVATRAADAPVAAAPRSPLDGCRVALLALEDDERNQTEERLAEWGCAVAAPAAAEVLLIACQNAPEGAALLGDLDVAGNVAVILWIEDDAVERPAGPDVPIFGLSRGASAARLRALLAHARGAGA